MHVHHAVFYAAPSIGDVPALSDLDLASPDVRVTSLETLDIGSVRRIIEVSSRRPLVEPQLTIVIEARSIAPEAQQALLKVLEEPPLTTRFIIVMPGAHSLLPTVRSRLAIESVGTSSNVTNVFTAFLALPLGARVEAITERTKAKDVKWINQVLDGAAAYASVSPDLRMKQLALTLTRYRELRGASRKMLLEELALSLPVMNEMR